MINKALSQISVQLFV